MYEQDGRKSKRNQFDDFESFWQTEITHAHVRCGNAFDEELIVKALKTD